MSTNPGYETVTKALLQRGHRRRAARLALRVQEGPGAGAQLESDAARVTVGSHPSNDLVIADGSVSRFHCSLEQTAQGLLVRDLDSRNGTFVHNVRIREGMLTTPQERIRLGESLVSVHLLERGDATPDDGHRFGPLLGRSPAMVRVFRILERVAPTNVTVLLEGETGTGKSLIARAIHQLSDRASGPFVVVDCAALPPTLIESELFGHERGSFTGAQDRRPGAFEAARGGTLFLDEIGELPAELQPKFLRVIEERQVKRVGANESIPVDVRLVAATNRDLCREVKAGAFRRDLYYRLDVVKVAIPALRERREDVRALARSFMDDFGHLPAPFTLDEADWVAMEQARWPGNVRELRAAIERALVLGDKAYLAGSREHTGDDDDDGPLSPERIDHSVPFREAKRRVVEAFERAFVRNLIQETDGNVSAAARLAKMDRNYLRTLISRYLEQAG